MEHVTPEEQNLNALKQEIERDLGFGMVPNVFTFAYPSPDVAQALWTSFRNVMLRGDLPRTIKEMMGVMVSVRAGSPYAAAIHLHSLSVQGLDHVIIESLRAGVVPAGLPARQRQLLEYAANPDPHLLDGYFTPEETREAISTVGLYRWINLWTDSLNIPIDNV